MASSLDPRSPRRRGLWGSVAYLLGAPVAAFNPRDIRQGAHEIRLLVDAIKRCQSRDGRILTEDAAMLDLRRTAFRFGVNQVGVEDMLYKRRRQTARATFTYLGGGLGFLGLWIYEALLSPSYASLGYVAALLAVCAVFFLCAFHNALVNWQARTRRLGTAREFLNARETWWPS